MQLRAFWQSQTGAVTVDWTILTAMALGFGVIVVLELSGGTLDMAGRIESTLSAATVESANTAQTVLAAAQLAPPP